MSTDLRSTFYAEEAIGRFNPECDDVVNQPTMTPIRIPAFKFEIPDFSWEVPTFSLEIPVFQVEARTRAELKRG